jgi:hypothetical protein
MCNWYYVQLVICSIGETILAKNELDFWMMHMCRHGERYHYIYDSDPLEPHRSERFAISHSDERLQDLSQRTKPRH